MTECARCGSTDLSPSDGPWWMDRVNARLFRTARCGGCGEYVHALTGERIAPLFWNTTCQLVLGVAFIPALTLVGPAWGGRPQWWFAGAFAAWWLGLIATLIRIRRRGT